MSAKPRRRWTARFAPSAMALALVGAPAAAGVIPPGPLPPYAAPPTSRAGVDLALVGSILPGPPAAPLFDVLGPPGLAPREAAPAPGPLDAAPAPLRGVAPPPFAPARIEPPLPPLLAPPAIGGADLGRSAAPEPPSPLQKAVAAALDRLVASPVPVPIGVADWRAARAAIRAFYADRLFTPLLVDDKGYGPAARAILGRLARAGEDGLDLAGYAAPAPPPAGASPDAVGAAEAALAAAVVLYAEEASGARVAPSRISPLITARPEVVDPVVALASVAVAEDPASRLAAFNPPQTGYRALRDELARLDREAPAAALGPPADAREGVGEARAPLIRARLDVAPGEPEASARVASVAAIRRTGDPAPNALLGPASVHTPEADALRRRRAAILANMEMWRWAPRDMGERRIEVNIPDYSLSVIDGDRVIHSARVIVGKPATPTPIFSDRMRYVTLNPSWRVPDSIIKKEMLPKLQVDPDYLARRGFEVKRVGEKLVVRQPPGEANALGHILFMFPNDHAVYLHDTPARGLFAAGRRAFSHGCVRVDKPMAFAEAIFGGPEQGWPARRFAAMVGSEERSFPLPRPLPIHLEYFTEFVDESGVLQEREDIYGVARRVADILLAKRQD